MSYTLEAQTDISERIEAYNRSSRNMHPSQLLRLIDSEWQDQAVLTTSLGMEDQLLTFLISEMELKTGIATLDTGRLYPESYELLERTQNKYGNRIKVLYPDSKDLTEFVSNSGINSFYKSVDLRKSCCRIRKVDPLRKELKNYKVWVTGIRSDQNSHRQDLNKWEWDEQFSILKVHPLLNLTEQEIDTLVDFNNIPVNPLHKKGYPSIGCAPCTRAVLPEEDSRAGRWWWENDDQECGLHISK